MKPRTQWVSQELSPRLKRPERKAGGHLPSSGVRLSQGHLQLCSTSSPSVVVKWCLVKQRDNLSFNWNRRLCVHTGSGSHQVSCRPWDYSPWNTGICSLRIKPRFNFRAFRVGGASLLTTQAVLAAHGGVRHDYGKDYGFRTSSRSLAWVGNGGRCSEGEAYLKFKWANFSYLNQIAAGDIHLHLLSSRLETTERLSCYPTHSWGLLSLCLWGMEIKLLGTTACS
jgi:hypothetical protein